MIIQFTNNKIELEKGSYKIYFLGGFYVKANKDFNVIVKKISDNSLVNACELIFKVRTGIENKKAIAYFNLKILEKTIYKIEFVNFEDIIMKESMLFSKRIFQKSIHKKDIEIYLSEG
jgi:hypothetical protein